MNPEIMSFQYATGMYLLLENVGGSEQNQSVTNVPSDDLWPSRMHAATHILQEKTHACSVLKRHYFRIHVSKCPNFTRFLPEKNSCCPNLGGNCPPSCPPSPTPMVKGITESTTTSDLIVRQKFILAGNRPVADTRRAKRAVAPSGTFRGAAL